MPDTAMPDAAVPAPLVGHAPGWAGEPDAETGPGAPRPVEPPPVEPRPAEPRPGASRPAEPRYTVAAVARRLGVAPATLRTWDRRYDLGPTEHQQGTRRRYSAGDLRRLELMRQLTLEGVAPAEAARLAIATAHASDSAAPEPCERVVDTPATPLGGLSSNRAARSGGRVLALPRGTPASRGLARAAMALDARAVAHLIRRSFEEQGVVATWEDLLRPVLVAAGRRWEHTGEGVEVEHLLSECCVAALRAVHARMPERGSPRPVLVACCEDEWHSLPCHVLAAALAEVGVPSRVLGAALPVPALHSAVRRLGPPVLFLWSQVPATAFAGAIETLPNTRPGTLALAGGPGWAGVAPLRRGRAVASLPEALSLIRATLGA